MLIHRSASVLHLYKLSSPPELLSQLKHSCPSKFHSRLCFPQRAPSLRRLINPPSVRAAGNFSTVASAADTEKETFFAEESVSWSSLGVCEKVSRALSSIGISRPSLIQAACIPSILSGKDVIVAAETGSGKTHSYLVPLIDRLLTAHLDTSTAETEQLTPSKRVSLVLCPNIMLCEQVARMTNDLRDDNGEQLLGVAAVCGRQGWPSSDPNIIVSTPAALLNNLDMDKYHRAAFLREVKYVVFDEADLLLCGSFQNQVIRLINMLRFDEKLLSRGKKSNLASPVETNLASEVPVDEEDEEDSDSDISLEDEDDDEDEDDFPDADAALEMEVEEENRVVGTPKKRDWRRVRKEYARSKQYIFVAATLPTNGKQTAGGLLKKIFPGADWVSGNYLHYHNPRLEHRWIEVNVETQVDTLIEAVKKDPKSHQDSGISRTMVFANTVEAVEAVANILERAEIECYRYHKNSSLQQRAETIVNFRDKGGIFVCTDAAARGLDVPNISHVIQADFATSAVDFLHRVGRTARAGQFGVITSLYTESNRDLVDAVRRAGKLGQPLETAFSRKRSFRNKLKKKASLKKMEMEVSSVEPMTV